MRKKTIDLTLEKALSLAAKYESCDTESVKFVAKKFNRESKAKSAEPSKKCSHCGYKNHASSECKYRLATCRKCGKAGHIATVCRSRAKSVNAVDGRASYAIDFGALESAACLCINAPNDNGTFSMSISVGGAQHSFLLDTGSSVSLVNESVYKSKFAAHPLHRSSVHLSA